MRRAISVLVVLMAGCASAQAQTLSLVCAWPKNPCCDRVVSIDLARSTVTSHPKDNPALATTLPARITESEISWTINTGSGWIRTRIDRVRGMLYAHDKDGAWDPMPCERAENVRPKF